MNKKEMLEKPFYLIARYWLGNLEGFIKIGDNEEEITKLFEEKYMSTPEHNFGVTEESYSLLKVSASEILDDEDEQSPYCEICGHCGEIGCCGIRNFIEEHIKGKTNCKNEDWVISDLISLCEYKDKAFEENKQLQIIANNFKRLKDNWDELKEYIDIKLYNVEYLQKLCGCRIDDEIYIILDIIKKEMQELEQESDSNGDN